jgi:hypothetical protein
MSLVPLKSIVASAALLLALSSSSSAATRVTEEDAVAQLKKTSASQFDPTLPRRAFGAWISEKFRDWNIQWKLGSCAEIKAEGKHDPEKEGPICVRVNVMQPGEEVHGDTSTGYHLLFFVGTEKKGLVLPRLQTITHKDGDEIEQLTSLHEVEP